MTYAGNRHSQKGHTNPKWFIALVVVVAVLALVFFLRRSETIGTIGILGNPPSSAEPLPARDGLSTGDTQKILRFNNGREMIAETDSVLDLAHYNQDRMGLRQGSLYLGCGKNEHLLEVSAPHLTFSVGGGQVTLAIGDATSTLDGFTGVVMLAGGRTIAPGLSVLADAAGPSPAVRDHKQKIGWIGRLLSDPARVRPQVVDTNLPGQVSGMVVEAESWKPLAGASVRAMPIPDDLVGPPPTLVDALGRFAFERVPDGQWWFMARKDNRLSQTNVRNPVGAPTFYAYRPSHPLVLVGSVAPYRIIVVDDRDKPLTGADVKLQGCGDTASSERTVSLGGASEMTFVPWPDYAVAVEVSKPGYTSVTSSFHSADPEGATDVKTVRLFPLSASGEKPDPGVFPPVESMY